jgi:Protein of unknown function (DUF3040)
MSLPTSEHQALLGIEQILQTRDPRLKSLFATFTRLTRHEAMPAREQIPRRKWWLQSSIVIPVTLMLLAGLIAVAALTGLTRACGPVRSAPGAVTYASRGCTTQTVSRHQPG